jgi:hypothetical protein
MATNILSLFIGHGLIWFNWGILFRFEEHEAPGSRSFFTEIIASVSDIKFARDGRHILSRDYMTLKVCNRPIYPVTEFIFLLLCMICARDINFITRKIVVFLYPGLEALSSSFNVINNLCDVIEF